MVELNNTPDDGVGVAQGCHRKDDDKEGGGCEHGVRGDADWDWLVDRIAVLIVLLLHNLSVD